MGQEAIIEIDFMVPAGIRLDPANGTVCLPDEVRVELGGRSEDTTDCRGREVFGDPGGEPCRSQCWSGANTVKIVANTTLKL